ncbi:hypothetical protein ACFL2G_01655 [Candidatus Omnitrophota bacterium]
MKYLIVIMILCFMSMVIDAGISCSADDRMYQPSAQAAQPQQLSTQKPIMPSVSPAGSYGAAPTPSPNVSTPSVSTGRIDMQSQSQTSMSIQQTAQGTSQHSYDLQAAGPIYFPGTVMGNSFGKVVDMGVGKDKIPWIELEDGLFNAGKLKIKVKDVANTTVVKDEILASLDDIKIGDTANIIFSQDGEDLTASFIGIMTEDAVKNLRDMSEEKKDNKASE